MSVELPDRAALPMATPSPRLEADNQRFPLDCMLYSQSVGFVCIAIQKSGCTTLKRWYAAMAEPGLAVEQLPIHKYCLTGLALSARPRDEAMRVLAESPTLAFVRDPLERLRSAFVEKIVHPRPTDIFAPSRELLEDCTRNRGIDVRYDTTHEADLGREIVRFPASRAVDYQRGLTFREFIEHVCHAPHEHLDPHWRPQAAFLRLRNADVLLPMSAIGVALDAIGRRFGATHSAADRTNVTRKEPAGRGVLTDVPSGELHRADLRPPVEELADDSIRGMIELRLAEDVALAKQAMQTDVLASVERLLAGKSTSVRGSGMPTI